jgi:protein-disulfide isomerase
MTALLEEQDKVAIDLELTAEPAVVVAGDGGTEVLMDAPDLGEIQAAIGEVR